MKKLFTLIIVLVLISSTGSVIGMTSRGNQPSQSVNEGNITSISTSQDMNLRSTLYNQGMNRFRQDYSTFNQRDSQNPYSNMQVNVDKKVSKFTNGFNPLTHSSPNGIGLDATSQPILFIDGNDGLIGFPGNGTIDSPYIISGLSLSSGSDLVLMQNTDLYVIFTENYFEGTAQGGNIGVAFINVKNVEFAYNTILQTGIGLSISGSNTINVHDNTISQNYDSAMIVYTSTVGSISNNTMSYNYDALSLVNTTNFRVSDNILTANDVDGLVLSNSHGNSIRGNQILDNGGDGIFLENSNKNIISENYIAGNGATVDPCARGCAPAIQITEWQGDYPFNFNTAYVAEGRVGNSDNRTRLSTYELDVSPSVAGPFLPGETGNFTWISGQKYPFQIFFDTEANAVSLMIGNTIVTHYSKVSLTSINNILFRASAINNASIIMSDVVLNYDFPLSFTLESSYNMGTPNTVEADTGTIIGDANQLEITGNVVMDWSNSGTIPFGSDISFQISFGNIPVTQAAVSSSSQNQPFTVNTNKNGQLVVNALSFGSGVFIDPSLDNIVQNNQIVNNAAIGLYLLDSNQTVIDQNNMSNNGLMGAFLENSNENQISSNTFSSNGIGSTTNLGVNALSFGSGVFIDPSFDNVVKNNVVSGNVGIGIHLQGTDRTDITGNQVSNNVADGVFLENSSWNKLVGNQIANNGNTQNIVGVNALSFGSGVFIDPSTDNIVANNSISGSDIGIHVYLSNRTEISGNMIASNNLDGVFIQDSNENRIIKNTISENGYAASQVLGLNALSFGSGVFIDPSVDNVVESNMITGNQGIGLHLVATNDTKINSNSVSDNSVDGVFLENSNRNHITNNQLLSNGWATPASIGLNALSFGSGVFIDPSVDNVVEGNVIAGNQLGIHLQLSDRTNVTDNIVSNNTDGIFLEFANQNRIISNQIMDNGYSNTALSTDALSFGSGVFIDPSFDNVVEGNIIDGNDVGMYLYESNGTQITNNQVTANNYDGVFLENSNQNHIIGNLLHSNGVLATQGSLGLNALSFGSGVFIDPSVGNVVKDNIVSSNFGMGIHLSSSNDTTIDSNTVSDNSLDGVFLENSNSNTISSNTISNNGGSQIAGIELNALSFGSGVFIDPSFDNVVSDNIITGNSGDGLFSQASSGTIIRHNEFKDNIGYGVNLDATTTNTNVENNNLIDNAQALDGSQARDDSVDGNNNFSNNYWSDADPGEPYMIDGNANNVDETPVAHPYIIGILGVDLEMKPEKIIINHRSRNPYYITVELPEDYVITDVNKRDLKLNDTLSPTQVKLRDKGSSLRLKFDGKAMQDLVLSIWEGQETPSVYNVTLTLSGLINKDGKIGGSLTVKVFVVGGSHSRPIPIDFLSVMSSFVAMTVLIKSHKSSLKL